MISGEVDYPGRITRFNLQKFHDYPVCIVLEHQIYLNCLGLLALDQQWITKDLIFSLWPRIDRDMA